MRPSIFGFLLIKSGQSERETAVVELHFHCLELHFLAFNNAELRWVSNLAQDKFVEPARGASFKTTILSLVQWPNRLFRRKVTSL